MENYIMINGKKIELTREQVKILQEDSINDITIEEGNKWRRVKFQDKYFYINNQGLVSYDIDTKDSDDNCRYNRANYNTDEEFMKMKALEFELNMLLTRFRDENDDEPNWNNQDLKYYFHYKHNTIIIGNVYEARDIGQVYFKNRKIAEEAFEEFKNEFEELKKYYKKYK